MTAQRRSMSVGCASQSSTSAVEASTFVVVSWSGATPLHLSPRGQRTAHLINALRAHGEVERVGGDHIPRWLAGTSERTSSSWHRGFARGAVHSVLIDKYELSARRSLQRWSPRVEGAVVVGYPCSPLPIAARRLARRAIPFIVDIGDPWMLTNPDPEGGWVSRWRASREERRLWGAARGVIVTTVEQGDALRRLFPHLRVLVRPNGYTRADPATRDRPQRVTGADGELRLVHYGSLYGQRVNFSGMLRRLADSGAWRKITFRHHGPDWEAALGSIPDRIELEHRPAISWEQVLAEAGDFDAAVVIGWRDPARMPSKTVQYLTLPIPRIAMVNAGRTDALTRYVADKPGWAVIDGEGEGSADIVTSHLATRWREADLQAPASESWPAVERVLGKFVLETIPTRGVPAADALAQAGVRS